MTGEIHVVYLVTTVRSIGLVTEEDLENFDKIFMVDYLKLKFQKCKLLITLCLQYDNFSFPIYNDILLG